MSGLSCQRSCVSNEELVATIIHNIMIKESGVHHIPTIILCRTEGVALREINKCDGWVECYRESDAVCITYTTVSKKIDSQWSV